jgi:predicted HTH transcriptional regulator
MESNRIEYKQQLTDDLEKEAIAFLNYKEGGVIYIGIDKTGDSVGVSDIDSDMLKIKDRLKNNIMPSCMGLFDVAVETIDSKEVIKITLASGTEKPYDIKKLGMSEKGCYIRTGTAAEPMTARQIEYLFAKRVRNSLGKIQSPRQDLTFEQLKIYYEAAGKTLNSQFPKNLELLTDQGKLNYVAYLMADVNGMSMKVAKYNGKDRVHLAENYEYGYCSLVKATKQILEKVELENKTFAKITPKERIETRLWDMIALREAIINAIVHNDYTREVPPKVEFFDDRIEITSYGGLPDGLSEEDFFEGVSMPRNKEIMRIFKDLELVEQLGSGVPRILQSYCRKCFRFLDNFIRMTFPAAEQVTEQVTEQVKKLVQKFGSDAKTSNDLMRDLELKHRPTFLYDYLKPALEQGFVEMTIPGKPNSRLQKYRLTIFGKQLKEKL